MHQSVDYEVNSRYYQSSDFALSRVYAEYLFLDQKRKLGLFKRIQKQIIKFDLSKENFDFVTN